MFSFSQQRGLFGQFANQSAVSSGQMKRPNAISSTLMRLVDSVKMSCASMIITKRYLNTVKSGTVAPFTGVYVRYDKTNTLILEEK